MAELLGTTTGGSRILLRGTLEQLRMLAVDCRCNEEPLRHWAIYRGWMQSVRFHNATDERFLIEHHNDPYWLNRGVPSKG